MGKSNVVVITNRSEALGLPRLEKATPEACLNRAYELDRLIKKGGLHESLVKQAKQYRSWCRTEARKGGLLPKRGATTKAKGLRAVASPAQLELPGVFAGLNMERVEMLAAQIFADKMLAEVRKNIVRKKSGKIA